MKKPIALLVMVLGLFGLMVADWNSASAAERGSGSRGASAPGGGGRGASAPGGISRGMAPSARAGGGQYYSRSGGYSGSRGNYHSRGHSHSQGHSHSYWSLGLSFGPYWYGPGYYPYSYPYYYPYPYAYPYYYPPAVAVPSEPRVYIERDDRVDSGQNSPWWYYCRESDTYYPYVKECAGQWERVPAQPQ